MGTGEMEVTLRLPNLECSQCILQWTYTAGNNWGVCLDGSGTLGCGPQETFRSCSDITISGNPVSKPTAPPLTSEASTASSFSTSSTDFSTYFSTVPTSSSSPTPSSNLGKACVAIGAWYGNANMAQWCFNNCYNVPAFCPENICDCLENEPSVETQECVATGILQFYEISGLNTNVSYAGPWTGVASMDSWCKDNCNNQPSFCPSNMCLC